MPRRSAALLWDAATAARRIQSFVSGKVWDDYTADLLLRSAVERQFEIAGEALGILRRLDPDLARHVPNLHKVVGMRNILIHGYAEVNHTTVWRAATEDLEALITAIDALLTEFDPPTF